MTAIKNAKARIAQDQGRAREAAAHRAARATPHHRRGAGEPADAALADAELPAPREPRRGAESASTVCRYRRWRALSHARLQRVAAEPPPARRRRLPAGGPRRRTARIGMGIGIGAKDRERGFEDDRDAIGARAAEQGARRGDRFRGDGTTEEERGIRPAAIVVHILLLRGVGRGRHVVGLVSSDSRI